MIVIHVVLGQWKIIIIYSLLCYDVVLDCCHRSYVCSTRVPFVPRLQCKNKEWVLILWIKIEHHGSGNNNCVNAFHWHLTCAFTVWPRRGVCVGTVPDSIKTRQTGYECVVISMIKIHCSIHSGMVSWILLSQKKSLFLVSDFWSTLIEVGGRQRPSCS